MNKTKNTNKTDRLDIRFRPEIKNLANRKAHEQNLTTSKYICNLIEKNEQNISHEQLIEHSLKENHFINSLLTNEGLSLRSKQLIGKEMKKYV